MNDISKTIAERGKTHGDFERTAFIAQELKNAYCVGEFAAALKPVQAEALDMICSKIARIVSGDPEHIDNWLDIEGYARLVRERLEK